MSISTSELHRPDNKQRRLLAVLLHQAGPRTVSQPEEDLDNKLFSTSCKISGMPRRKDKIFPAIMPTSSSTAMLILSCAVIIAVSMINPAEDQMPRHAIDIDEIGKEITLVVEGKDAFAEMRKEKYGCFYQDICARNHSPPYYLAPVGNATSPRRLGGLSWQVLLRCLSAVAVAPGVIVPFWLLPNLRWE